ncbi:MAG: trypsin-like serine protease [Sphingobacteriales bacterium]|nr:MAG: trypsin-like serine protease [Sphingobacteriales bacterium]
MQYLFHLPYRKFSVSILCLLASCSCLFAQQASVLATVPDNAEVIITSNNSVGVTPFDLNQLPAGVTKIIVKKEGFEPVEIDLEPKPKKGYVFPGSVKSCSACLMDFTGNPFEPKMQSNATLRLQKKIKAHYGPQIGVAINTASLKLAPKAVLGNINGSEKRIDDKDINLVIGYPENITTQLLKPLEGTYLDATHLSASTKNEDNTKLYKPKIILSPIVNDLKFNLKGKLYRDYAGPALIEVTWNISTIADQNKLLASIPVKTAFYRTGNNYEIILHELLAKSERDLLENDTLYTYLQKLERQYLVSTKSKPQKISMPQKLTAASTREMLKSASGSVVTVENDEGFGSGVIISNDGYIITNHHVIKPALATKVILQNKAYTAEVISLNSDYDLALLKINAKELPALRLAVKNLAEPGDEVFAIGTPLNKNLGSTVTKGIISGFREINGVKFIQTDVSINSGNSGGPLLNEEGEIVGITTVKLAGRGVEGVGFCILSTEVLDMLNLKFY